MRYCQALILVVALNLLRGQQGETPKPIEPELIGAVYYLDSSAGALKPLPKEQWKAVGKAKAGWSTVNSTGSLQLDGVASSLRIPASDRTDFVFQLGSGVDPTKVRLYLCSQDMKKGWRVFDVVQIQKSGSIHATNTQVPLTGIPVEIVKYGESSYKLTARHLAPGEYAISGIEVFSFSVQ